MPACFCGARTWYDCRFVSQFIRGYNAAGPSVNVFQSLQADTVSLPTERNTHTTLSHRHARTHVHTHSRTHAHIHTHTHARTHAYIHTYIHTRTHRRAQRERERAHFHSVFRPLCLNSIFESPENRAVRAAMLCSSVCISDVMNEACLPLSRFTQVTLSFSTATSYTPAARTTVPTVGGRWPSPSTGPTTTPSKNTTTPNTPS